MKILITEFEEFSQVAKENLEKIGQVDAGVYSYSSLFKVVGNYEVLVIRLGIYFDKKMLDKARKLKYIITPTTGLDHIDLQYAKNLGVEVLSLKGEAEFLESIPSTAEHTWGLILALLRRTTFANEHVKQGGWDRNIFKGNNVKAKKLGIIGYGRVGKMIAKYGQAFECEVGVYDIDSSLRSSQVKWFETIEQLLAWGDIITVHIPFDDENKNFLDSQKLSHLKENAFLINTSRGGVWDEQFICDLLENGKIGGVAADVLTDELDPDALIQNPLLALQKKGGNLIVTPHIAGATYESMAATEEFVVDKLVTFLDS